MKYLQYLYLKYIKFRNEFIFDSYSSWREVNRWSVTKLDKKTRMELLKNGWK